MSLSIIHTLLHFPSLTLTLTSTLIPPFASLTGGMACRYVTLAFGKVTHELCYGNMYVFFHYQSVFTLC